MIKTKTHYSLKFYFHSEYCEGAQSTEPHVIFETPYHADMNGALGYSVRENVKLAWELWCYLDVDCTNRTCSIAPSYKSEFIATANRAGEPAYAFTLSVLEWLYADMPVEDSEGFLSEEIKGYKFLPQSVSYGYETAEVVVNNAKGDTNND